MVRLRFLALFLMLCLSQAGFAAQADSRKDEDPRLMWLRIDADKELAHKNAEALDKRIDDQANRIADIGASVDRFGILLTGFGILIAVGLAGLGLLGYFSVASRAREQAKEAAKDQAEATAKRYFEENATSIRKEIEALRQKGQQAHSQIDDQTGKVQAHAEEAMARNQAVLDRTFSRGKPSSDNVDEDAALKQVAEVLKHTPESAYRFKDWNTRAFAAYQAGQLDEAALYWKRAVEVSDGDPADAALALVNRSVLLVELGRHDEAVAACDLAESRYGADSAPALREQVAKALNIKSVAQGKLGRHDDVVVTCELVESRYGADSAPRLREQVAKALYNKGVALDALGRHDEAMVACGLVDSRYGADSALGLRQQVAQALYNKGVVLCTLGRYDDAVAAWDMVDRRYGTDPAPGLREQVAKALNNKGVAVGRLGRNDEAVAIFDLVESRYGADSAPRLREQVAKARNGKGFGLLMKAKRQWPEDKERWLKEAHIALDLALAVLPEQGVVLGNLAYVAWLLGDAAAAEQHMRAGLSAAEGGGEALYKATLDDIGRYPVPPDDGFLALVERLWQEWCRGRSD